MEKEYNFKNHNKTFIFAGKNRFATQEAWEEHYMGVVNEIKAGV